MTLAAMALSRKGLSLIKEFEKLGPHVRNKLIYPYLCPAGWITIGYGHVIKENEVKQYFTTALTLAGIKKLYQDCSAKKDFEPFLRICKPITEAQADALLQKDQQFFVNQVNRRLLDWKVSIPQNFFDALVSLAYNAGAGSLDGTIKTRLIAGDIDGAILWLPMFCLADVEKAKGVILRNVPVTGLTLRRFSEVWLALTGEVWRVGPTKASQRPDMEKFVAGVRDIMAAKGKRSPLPYPRNRLENQVA